jgi:hypothetical protein
MSQIPFASVAITPADHLVRTASAAFNSTMGEDKKKALIVPAMIAAVALLGPTCSIIGNLPRVALLVFAMYCIRTGFNPMAAHATATRRAATAAPGAFAQVEAQAAARQAAPSAPSAPAAVRTLRQIAATAPDELFWSGTWGQPYAGAADQITHRAARAAPAGADRRFVHPSEFNGSYMSYANAYQYPSVSPAAVLMRGK